ncbi:immunoglobulin superfamily member 1-like [Sarcophilus harrisii]
MDSTLTFLLSIGLFLHCEVKAQTEIFRRPTLWALPSPVVPKGANVTLRCQGQLGSDRFQLWKDGELREERNESWSQAEFVLRKVDDWKDARSYRCRSGKGPLWSELSDPLALVVTGVFAKPNIEASADSLISPGETVTIWCQMPQQSPIKDYGFALLDAKSLEPLLLQIPAGPRTEFSLPSVRAKDTGSYSCIYYKKIPPHRASHLSSAMELTVLGQLPRPTLWAQPGLVVAPGTNITLWCSRPRLASPKEVTFTLRKIGSQEPLQSQDSETLWTGFSLPSVRPEDTGSYKCTYKDKTASGRETESSEALELVVTGSLPKPSLSAFPGLVVEPGSHVTLQCRQPPRSALWRATFTLLKVGNPQPLQSQSPAGMSAVFPLLSVGSQDAGNYTCVYYERMAPFQVSEPSEILEIQVTDQLPKPSLSASPGLKVVSGTNVTLLCWGPSWAARFILYKEGVEEIPHSVEAHEDGGQFLLTHVTPKDSGIYSCSYQLGTNGNFWKQCSDVVELLVRGSLRGYSLQR